MYISSFVLFNSSVNGYNRIISAQNNFLFVIYYQYIACMKYL